MTHPTLGSLGDPARLSAVHELGLLDTPPEEAFDRLTRLARAALSPKVAAICLLTEDRQFFKSATGLPEPWASRRQLPLSHSLCRHVVESGHPFTVKDTREHPATARSPAATELGAVAYAGVPLSAPAGHVVGTVCAWDEEPRSWAADELRLLRDLAELASFQLESGRRKGTTPPPPTGDGLLVLDAEWRPVSINARGEELLLLRRADLTSGTLWESLPRLVGSRTDRELRRAREEGVSAGFVEYRPELRTWLEVEAHPEPDGGLAVRLRDVGRREWAERELADRSRRTALLAAVEAAVRSGDPLQQVFDRTMAALVRHLDAAVAQTWSTAPDGGESSLESSAGIFTRFSAGGAHAAPTARLIDRIVRTARPYSVNGRHEVLHELGWPEREGVVAFAGTPIDAGGRTVGAIVVFMRRPVTQTAREALEAVAERLGHALSRMERPEPLAERMGPAAGAGAMRAPTEPLLRGIADAMLRHEPVDELLSVLAHLIREAFDAEAVSVLLLDADSVRLEPRATVGVEDGAGPAVPLGAGIAGRIVERREPVHIGDAAAAATPSIALGSRFRSVLAAPLVVDGDATGAVLVASEAPGQFTEANLERLRRITEPVALAVDRSDRSDRDRRAREEAEATLRVHDEVLAIVSHDLRSPVATILAAVEVLAAASERGEGVGGRAVEQIRTAAGRVNRLVEDLLEASRLESGHFSLTPEWFDVRPVVHAARDAVELQASDRGIRVDVDVRDHVPEVHADRDRILQALSNLVSNAVKFTETGGSVRIGAQLRGDSVCFSVSDTGPGIPEEQRPYLFDRYWQAKRANRADAGLGLTIVEEIVHAHGGRIWVESRVGEGSTFYFTVPLGERD